MGIFCLQLPAQSSYGSIVGTVTDQSGAIIRDAKVTLTNSATSERIVEVSNASGNYQFSNLQPGIYQIDVVVTGFKELTRDQVQVAVQVASRVDAVMQVGDVGQRVEVTGSAPLLNTEDATVGQVVEGRTVTDMPLNGRNIMNMTELAPGVIAHGQSQGQTTRSGYSNYQISGGIAQVGKTELDGTPLNTGLFNGQGMVPIQDTVQEFQVMANDIPAQFGATLDGVINMASKPGTDEYHAEAYEFIRNKVLNANTFFNNRNGIARAPFTQNQFGLNGGGPIKRGKTFIFLAWEEFRLRTATTASDSVPTLAERTGDFSNLRTAAGVLIPIYDPATTCGQINYLTQTANPACVAGQPTRTQFANNMIPKIRFDGTAAIMLQYWPMPNQPGAANTFANNYVVSVSAPDNRDWAHLRVDQVLGSKQRMFATFDRFTDITPENDPYALGSQFNYNQDAGDLRGVLADTYTLNNSTVIDAHLAYSRVIFTRIPNTLGINLTSFGWPASYNSDFLKTQFPTMSPTGLTSSESSQSAIISQYSGNGYLTGSLLKIVGRHTVKVGGEYSWLPTAYAQGQTWSFAFNANFTAANPLSPGNTGYSFASYLLGLGNSGTVSNTLSPYSTMHIGGLYASDQYQPVKRLTLTLGTRWDDPGFWIERHGDQSVFIGNATNPVLSAAGLNYPGDVVLVSSPRYSNNTNQNPHWDLFAPRVGAAFRLNDKSVVRGGFGITYAPGAFAEYQLPYEESINNANTAWVPTQNSGTTPVNTLSNPFPGGVNPAPGRNASYESSLLGSAVITGTPQNAWPSIQNWNIGFARQLGSSSVIDLAYVGTHALHLPLETDPNGGRNINQIPDQYDSMGSALLTAVTNPFSGIVQTGTLSKATIPAGQLLLPYPQYTTIATPTATFLQEHYNAFQAKFQRHFQDGGTLLVAYTYSKNYGNGDSLYGHTEPFVPGTIQDFYNPSADNSILSYDVRNYLTVAYVLNLPFGKGEPLLASANGVAGALVSGWGFDGVTTLESGFPVPLTAPATSLSTNFGTGTPRPNVTAGCNTTNSGAEASRLQTWFNASCFAAPSTFGFGNEPRVDPNIRNSGVANSDLALFRNASLGEKFSLQFRAEAFNLFNRVQFGSPGNQVGTSTFGVVSSQTNNARLLQFALKIRR
jgi:hypothetical protein